MLHKWRIGVLNCFTLAITYHSLDNAQLSEPEAVSIVARWNAVDAGRRLNWLDGRADMRLPLASIGICPEGV